MQARGKALFLLLVACALAIGLSSCAKSPVQVLSAKRSRSYSLGFQTAYPDKPGTVFLVVTYAGLSADDRKKTLYITDGKNRYPTQLGGVTIKDDKANSFVVVTVPESQLEFQVALGDYPPVSFRAAETIDD